MMKVKGVRMNLLKGKTSMLMLEDYERTCEI